MVRFASLAILGAALLATAGVQAGGEKFGIGSAAPAFTDLPGVDGKKHSLGEYKKDVVVLAITCNHCPVAVNYEDRVIALAKKYGKQINLVAINVNNLPADKLDKMKERAAEKGFNFPYLYDATQKIARDLKASVTPEFYVFNKGKLVYWGPLDDNQDATKAKNQYLAQAIDAALKGETPTAATKKAFGCGIKYEKQ